MTSSARSGDGLTRPPTRRIGDYEVLSELGKGGMAVVYKARDLRLGRIVALKLLQADRLTDPKEIHRFRIEAEASAKLDHPNIVPIYEVGLHEGQPFFIMKLVDGGNLRERAPDYQLNPRATVEVILAVARAVGHAHRRGILHRDLKPANILLDPAGKPMLTDFGLAKRIGQVEGLTRTGAIVGTPSYMSPEQARSDSKALTTATDVWGLGAVLYSVLAMRTPFQGDNPLDRTKILERIIRADPDPPSRFNRKVDAGLDAICLKCLEKEPANRYRTADALASDLQAWLAGESLSARPDNEWQQNLKWVRQHPAAAAVVGLLILASLALTVNTVSLALSESGQEASRIQRERLMEERDKVRPQRTAAEREAADVDSKLQNARRRFAELSERRRRLEFQVVGLTREVHRLRGLVSTPEGRVDTPTGPSDEELTVWAENGRDLCRRQETLAGMLWLLRAWHVSAGRTGKLAGLRAELETLLRQNVTKLGPIAPIQTLRLAGAIRTLTVPPVTPVGKSGDVEPKPESERLLATAEPFGALLWEGVEGKIRFESDADATGSAFFSQDGQVVWLASAQGQVKRLELPSGQPLKGQPIWPKPPTGSPPRPPRPGQPPNPAFFAVAINPAGGLWLVVRNGRATLWNAATGTEVSHNSATLQQILAVTFLPDGRGFLTVHVDGRARVRTSKLVEQSEIADFAPKGSLGLIALDPAGAAVAHAHPDGRIQVWQTATGRAVAEFKPNVAVRAVALGLEGRLLAWGGADGQAEVRDTTSGQSRWQRPSEAVGGDADITALAISVDGRSLWVGSADGHIREWAIALPATPPESMQSWRSWLAVQYGWELPPGAGRLAELSGYQRRAALRSLPALPSKEGSPP